MLIFRPNLLRISKEGSPDSKISLKGQHGRLFELKAICFPHGQAHLPRMTFKSLPRLYIMIFHYIIVHDGSMCRGNSPSAHVTSSLSLIFVWRKASEVKAGQGLYSTSYPGWPEVRRGASRCLKLSGMGKLFRNEKKLLYRTFPFYLFYYR